MKTLPTEKLLEECEMLSVENDWKGIINATNEILDIEDKNIRALSYRATAHCRLGEYASALEFIGRILEIEPDDGYFRYMKIKALSRLGRADEAYDFYRSLNDDDPNKEALELLVHALIDKGEHEKALECLDRLSERNWLFCYRIVDGYKRIENLTRKDLSDRYDSKFRMSWIDMIRYKSDVDVCPICGGSYENQFGMCENCCEEIQMSPMGAHIECDDLKIYYYICDKLHTLKGFLKGYASLDELHKRMDYLDDEEFNAFISHLKSIHYVVEASRGYIWDGDEMKEFCDAGKHAAPRWLAFPGFTAWTIGWRMGAGEDYCMNEPPRGREFRKLFPQPKNWMFNPRDPKFERFGKIPFLAFPWDGDIAPKYSRTGGDAIEVNGFITPELKRDFRVDALHFTSIEHALLLSKFGSYNRIDPYRVTFEELQNDFGITDEELAEWNVFRYAVCLNAAYYLFMQDNVLKQKLLDTGDADLIYISDDEWGGEDNLFGFALMEVRDEIKRLWRNEDLIDWRYTEYLKQAYPYISHRRDVNDRQSAEYRVVESTLAESSRYVRDVNLDGKLASKYEAGMIITERGFVDASSRIGGMATSHRYLILSRFMADFSRFEENTNWGLHVANKGSRFKVLDIFTVEGKTQILLVHLPEGFEGVFEQDRDVEQEFVERERENFKRDLKKDVIDDLKGEDWMIRCSFPLGMDDEGEFF